MRLKRAWIILSLSSLSLAAWAQDAVSLSGTAASDSGAGSLPALPQQKNLVSFGTMDRSLGLTYEHFLDGHGAIQAQVDSQVDEGLSSAGAGLSYRYYPVGDVAPCFYGGLRSRVFEQNERGKIGSGFYRGLRGGPVAGIRLPLYRQWVLSYELDWSWDLSLYQSDPAHSVGDAWMADGAAGDKSGRISDSVSIGYVFGPIF